MVLRRHPSLCKWRDFLVKGKPNTYTCKLNVFLLFVHPNVIFEYFFHPFSSISEVQNFKSPITPALLGECLAHTGAIHVS